MSQGYWDDEQWKPRKGTTRFALRTMTERETLGTRLGNPLPNAHA